VVVVTVHQAVVVVPGSLVAPSDVTEINKDFMMNNLLNKIQKKGLGFLLLAVSTTFLFATHTANALTIGETYTITIEKVNSDGTLTSGATSLGISTTATADSDGKLSFSFSSAIPNNSSCNFMVVTLTNSSDAVERRSVVPCPNAGETVPLGVSGVTKKQADAIIAAFAAAGTDDPILAVFGLTIVRSESITASELSFMANLCKQGISGTGGFVADMTSKGVTTTQLATYRNKIVSTLANPTSGYSKFMKDAVDVASSGDPTLEAAKRGEAASKLLSVLVTSATDAGFSQDRPLEAFNAMGSVVVPLMATAVADGNLSAATKQAIDSTVGGGISKLRADRGIEKYAQALSTLGASGSDLTTYQSAANTLVSTMQTAFATFDKVFNGSETKTDVEAAQTTLNNTMSTAFSTFISSTASSDARLATMISNIDSALGTSTGLTKDNFQFYTQDGSATNWPIMMVIPTDWLSSIKTAGGDISYTRDSLTIPSSMTWLGTCSAGGYYEKTSCESAGKTWTAGRTDYSARPYPYRALFEVQEDIMIREFARFDAQSSAGSDMSAQNTLEKAFADALVTIASNISGTTDGSTAVTSAQKTALVELMKSPQF
jgi:hypothetical protein